MAVREIGRKVKPNGDIHVTLLLRPGEEVQVTNDSRHYKLGYPVEDVVPGHVIANAKAVSWCPLSQQWVDN